MSRPVQQKRVEGRPGRCVSKHPVPPALPRGPAFTEMANPGTANSAGFRCATRSAPKPPLLLHICRAEVTLAHKVLMHSRSQTLEPASPCSIIYPPCQEKQPTATALCRGHRAASRSGLAKRSTCKSFKLWPGVLCTPVERWNKLSVPQTITGRWRRDNHRSAL